MINKKIEDIQERDLQELIENKVLEGKTIEYKRKLPGNSDTNKKEFLADVTSFANTSGGDLIYGIEEDNSTHSPISLTGLGVENIDTEKTRLDNIIRTGVEPRLPNLAIHPIPLGNSNTAILIRTRKSWISPHRVILGGHAKFYARNSSGKYEMDVDELRVTFNLSETIIEKIRGFRADRIAKVETDDTPVTLYSNPKILLHLIALDAFQPAQQYDMDRVYEKCHDKLRLIYLSVLSGRYNLDGIVTHSDVGDGKYSGYTQLYRNGIIEAVDAKLLRDPAMEGSMPRYIPSYVFEKKLMESMASYLALMDELMIPTPIYVFLTLLNVKGYKITTGDRFDPFSQYSIDRSMLVLPEIRVDNYAVRVEAILKPIFDLIWNACGEPRSLNFDENGNWIERQ